MQPRFEVHSHTHYSNLRLLDATNMPSSLIKYAQEIGLKGIAITDHECISGSIQINKIMNELNEQGSDFKVAIGNEIYLVDERTTGQKYYHFILIAKDKEGHKQLRKLSSNAWLNGYYDNSFRVPTLKSELRQIIKKNPGHLIATTACIGGELSSNFLMLNKAEIEGDIRTQAECQKNITTFLTDMIDIFEKDFYIEIAPGNSNEQQIVNGRLYGFALGNNIPIVIGCDAHYLRKEDRFVHKAYLESDPKNKGQREIDGFYEYSYLQTEEEIINNLGPLVGKDYEKFCANSMEIYNKIEHYSLMHSQQIPKVEVKDYPKPLSKPGDYFENNYPILSSMFISNDKTERYWVNECIKKLNELGKNNEEYLSRLEEEADIKKTIGEALDTNMFAYPVTLQHYVDLFWECGSTVGAGRGSSCSGLNHYLLGITQLDPIEWDLPFWRYLNKERFELGDIDLDLCPSKRPIILEKIKEERGAKFIDEINEVTKSNCGCTLIATFGTETSKSAIQTACRGYRSEDYPDGIDVDTAQYMSSLIPVERGFLWSLKEVVEGNKDKGRKPVLSFISEVNQYPGLLDIMLGVEGLISRRGSHASGVILFDEDPYEFGCFMRTPSGDVITQYDLHDCEAAGLTKYDFLVTAVQDKIVQTVNFLQEYGEIDENLTLREVYNQYLHPQVLPVDDVDIWRNIQQVNILDLFQFDSAVGSQAAKKIKPTSMMELSDANGLMRLMTAEKGQETPMDKYVRFKNNLDLWYNEMNNYGLTMEEQEALKPHFLRSHGVPPSQEQMMTMLMDPKLCDFSLKDANAARKIVGKKQMSKIPLLHEQVEHAAKSPALARYIWDCGIGPQMGYSFSIIHALAYSFIAFQTAYLSTKFDPIYWDTACLVVNSGSLDENEDNGTDYAKVAKAIGAIKSNDIEVSLVNINTSDFGFKPDVENNRILYGLKGISYIGSDVIDKIKENRPYTGIKDFMSRCKLDKRAMVNLIKAGAFDEIEKDLNRKAVMVYYLYSVGDLKKRLTLQNFNGLIQYGLVPEELELSVRVFNFNKYLKTKKIGKYFTLDDISVQFLEKFLSDKLENVEVINGVVCILQTNWKKIYDSFMDAPREWIKQNHNELLNNVNNKVFAETWEKYADGNESHWEMESLCFYHGEHELANVNVNKYGIVDFNTLSKEPEVDYFYKRAGHQIPIYKLYRIIGTVIAKDDNRHSVALLTTTGVVNIKFTRDYYAMFKKQISVMQANGKKKVVEKGWFSRGNMLMITGFRREDQFVAKTYAKTVGHQLYKIVEVCGDEIKVQHERFSENGAMEEDEEDGY